MKERLLYFLRRRVIKYNLSLSMAAVIICRNSDIARFCIISKELKVVYIINPKVANTSIKKLFAHQGHSENIHQRIQGCYFSDEIKWNELKKILTQDGYQIFSVVRHPVSRIFSAYKDKILFKTEYNLVHRRNIGLNSKESISFLDFLTLLKEKKKLFADLHWMPQTNLLLPNTINYNFIGKVEFPSELDDFVMRVFGRNLGHSNASQALEHRLGPLELDLIHELYSCDFENFCYE